MVWNLIVQLADDIACAVLDPVPGLIDSAAGSVASGIESVDRCVQDARENPVEATLAVAAIAATGGYLLAGPMAAKLGAWGLLGSTQTTNAAIGALRGVALTKASLAKIGGGALSVGGYGVAGGKAVVAATCAATSVGATRLVPRSQVAVGTFSGAAIPGVSEMPGARARTGACSANQFTLRQPLANRHLGPHRIELAVRAMAKLRTGHGNLR